MDYKQIIDGLKWVQSAEEIELSEKFELAQENKDWDTLNELFDKLREVRTEPPLRKVGLEKPVYYAFQARAEYEMLKLAEEMGLNLKTEFDLHPAGQQGIGLNWVKLSESGVYVPRQWLECETIEESSRAIFQHDELNCIGRHDPERLELAQKVVKGPDITPEGDRGTSEGKIKALCSNPEWRKAAKEYASLLLNQAGIRYTVQKEYVSVLKALVSAYRSEMK